MAYGRASWPWRLTVGSAAKISPAHRPAWRDASLRAIAVTPAAAAAIATADGSLVTSSPVPATRTTGHSSR
jgi:hypothetical protein